MIPLKDNNPTQRMPLVNLFLIGINASVFAYQFFYLSQGPADLIQRLGFIPYELRHFTDLPPHNLIPVPLTLFSAMFIHGGWLHFLGNMLYLWVFGDNVEDRLGHLRYLAFYLACGLCAGLIHTAFFPHSQVPCVGASGAIAGVLAAYMLTYPRARITTLVFIFFFIRIIRLPAIILLGLWILLQIVSGLTELSAQAGGIAWFAHIGGFAAGLLLVVVIRPKKQRRFRRPLTNG